VYYYYYYYYYVNVTVMSVRLRRGRVSEIHEGDTLRFTCVGSKYLQQRVDVGISTHQQMIIR